jgi:hypothetical protein
MKQLVLKKIHQDFHYNLSSGETFEDHACLPLFAVVVAYRGSCLTVAAKLPAATATPARRLETC